MIDLSDNVFQLTTCHLHHQDVAYEAHFWPPPPPHHPESGTAHELAAESDTVVVVSSSDSGGREMDVMSGGIARQVKTTDGGGGGDASQDGKGKRGRDSDRSQMSTLPAHVCISFRPSLRMDVASKLLNWQPHQLSSFHPSCMEARPGLSP